MSLQLRLMCSTLAALVVLAAEPLQSAAATGDLAAFARGLPAGLRAEDLSMAELRDAQGRQIWALSGAGAGLLDPFTLGDVLAQGQMQGQRPLPCHCAPHHCWGQRGVKLPNC